MGTATLKSIFDKTSDQRINTLITVNNATHKNGEEKTTLRKTVALVKSVTGSALVPRVLFLKKNCTAVSRISLAKLNLRVNLHFAYFNIK